MQDSIHKVVQYHFDDGNFTALLLNEGRKHIHLLPMTAFGDTGMRVVKVPVRDARAIRDVQYKGHPYNYGRALIKFRAAYRKFGGTKGVKQALYG